MTDHMIPGADGGSEAPTLDPWPSRERITGTPAVVHHGRPVTAGPAVCQGCGSLVWWSGALWTERDGLWHRCAP